MISAKGNARMAPEWLRRIAPPGLAAITIGRTIWCFRKLTPPEFIHEATHVRQFAERGVIRGSAEYLLLALLYGYDAHPWEREARTAERDAGRRSTGTPA